MDSMTAALAAHTLKPPDPAAKGGWIVDAFSATWTWAADHLPGGNLGVISIVAAVVMLANNKKAGGAKTDWKKADKALLGIVKELFGMLRGLAKAVWAVARFYGGREVHGGARSTATFLRAGTPTVPPKKAAPAVSMASIALAPPKVSLVKPKRRKPSPWARKSAAWIKTYAGRGARFLDRAVRLALWTARVAGKVWRGTQAVYRFLAPVAANLARVARLWSCWPYAARGLARVVLTLALFGLTVPAWRGWTLVGLVLVAAGAVAAGHRFQPKPLSDDAVYGPRIWAILRADLKLPEDEDRQGWLLLPPSLAAPDARIVVRLPWTWRGGEGEREALTALINSRLPGEWVARVTLTGETFTAVYTHKPPPRPPMPAPEPPAAVDIWDPRIQEILTTLGPDQFYLGQDENDQAVIQQMSGAQAHWAFSVGSGGGKSALLHFLAIQMVIKGGTIIPIDPKMVSMTPLLPVEGVHSYINPENPQDMRAAILWVAEVVKARNYEKKNKIRTSFPDLYLILEECNELADLLKEEYSSTKSNGDPAGDPIRRDGVAKVLRLGREVNVHIIAVFQDFKDNQFAGVSLLPLFPLKVMGSYTETQWKRIIGTGIPIVPSVKKAGRMVVMRDDGSVTRLQVPYVPFNPEISKDENQQQAYARLTAYYNELRATYGRSTEALYSTPPAASPDAAPRLLRALSRDGAANGPLGGPGGGLSDETAGRLSHDGTDVTLQTAM